MSSQVYAATERSAVSENMVINIVKTVIDHAADVEVEDRWPSVTHE